MDIPTHRRHPEGSGISNGRYVYQKTAEHNGGLGGHSAGLGTMSPDGGTGRRRMEAEEVVGSGDPATV